MIDLTVTLLAVLSTILDHSVEAQCYTDSGESAARLFLLDLLGKSEIKLYSII